MKRRSVVALVATMILAVAVPAVVQAEDFSVPGAKASFESVLTKRANGNEGRLLVRYRCKAGDGVWVSAKQTASGRRDNALMREGSSEVAATWLDSHRNAFVCDGTSRKVAFKIDKLEPGKKGALKPGKAWVQFCIVTEQGEGGLILSKSDWLTVR